MPKRAVAILEEMWQGPEHAGKRAPRWFKINPQNKTGSVLYKWTVGYELLVTNACSQIVANAKGKGTPDYAYLYDNVRRLDPIDLLLVCGKVAQETYDETCLGPTGAKRVIYVAHPAARIWTKKQVEYVRALIAFGVSSVTITLHRDGRATAKRLLEEDWIPF